MAQGDDIFSIIASNVLTKSYTATGLTAGLTYKFKVESRNYVYYSSESLPVTILCASKPSIPAAPTTANENDLVKFDWAAPSENGLPITSYSVLIEKKDLSFN
jgi:hypothetical protein